MRRRIVVDASVVVKWLVPEDQSLRAVSLRERFDFAAPDLIHAEIVNILWKKARRGCSLPFSPRKNRTLYVSPTPSTVTTSAVSNPDG